MVDHEIGSEMSETQTREVEPEHLYQPHEKLDRIMSLMTVLTNRMNVMDRRISQLFERVEELENWADNIRTAKRRGEI